MAEVEDVVLAAARGVILATQRALHRHLSQHFKRCPLENTGIQHFCVPRPPVLTQYSSPLSGSIWLKDTLSSSAEQIEPPTLTVTKVV
ncbi:hypothetical protein J6590_079150 [Homalodisca vitripennis]|nr:hypothetical protein J6590_079150 [Homalodisca vitripennis]